jgi:hypothetical protein
MAVHRKRRVKVPALLAYANAPERFQTPSEENVDWAFGLFTPLWRPPRVWARRKREVWERLGGHQAAFRAFLDGLLTDETLPHQWATYRTYALQPRITPTWTTGDPDENPYQEYWEPQDALEAPYFQLRLLLEKGTMGDLHKCPVCDRFFLPLTARAQRFCDTPCRLKGNLRRRERNKAYQQRHRDKVKEADLRKVRAAIDAILERDDRETGRGGVTPIDPDWVVETAGLGSRRRFTTLMTYERERYGRPRVTDLAAAVEKAARRRAKPR